MLPILSKMGKIGKIPKTQTFAFQKKRALVRKFAKRLSYLSYPKIERKNG